ncbi:MAG TPA: PadR family transcriptional regulator [Thermoanaerobaculia bacterium]|nr:PadR family transcriptional regulator [Thermoanaerobaculia bacterium]
MRRGLLELCILGLLEHRPSYGYEIVTRLAGVPALAVGEGTIYPLLRRLKSLGRLTTYWQESEAGPPRQYYRLSAAGEEYLSVLRGEWAQLAASVDEIMGSRAEPRGPARATRIGRGIRR